MPEDFKTQVIPFGQGTLDLLRTVGTLAPENYARLLNCIRRQDGLLTGRPGLTNVLTGLDGHGFINSIARLNERAALTPYAGDPLGLTPVGTRFLGNEKGDLFYAPGSVAQNIATELFSGQPLCFLAYRPPLAATAWLYIADSLQMRKVSPQSATTALLLPLGLPAPTNPDARMPMDEFPPELYFGGWTGGPLILRQIANFCLFGFEAVKGTTPLLVTVRTVASTTIDRGETSVPWSGNAGSGGAPAVATDAVNFKEGLASLKFTTNAGGAVVAYYNFFNRALALDLTRVGTIQATDEDHIHGWIRADRPDLITELRVYFILGTDYSATVLPGTSSTANSNFYAKAIRAADFTAFLEGTQSGLGAQTTANTNTQAQQAGGGGQAAVPPLAGGRGAWTEFGSAEFPLPRGDFKRYGADQTLDWSNVTGMCFMVYTNAASVVNVWLDDMRLSGGGGPDSSVTGNVSYDYRYRNYDPRTGVKGNACQVSLEQFWVDAVRQSIVAKPQPYGDPAIRQQLFRRGGSLVRAWYKTGENGLDGGEILDNNPDNFLLNAEILEEDNDQPVTSVDALGHTVLAQPLHTIFGPADDVIFGLGDPNRRGDIYWSKKGDADAWPSYNHRELCGSSEELIAGYMGAAQPFCMSRERGFVLYPNLGGDGQMGYAPTGCSRGPVSRTAYAVGPGGACFFLARDGFYVTSGGPEQSLSDQWVRPLFRRQSANGYYPLDYARADAVRVVAYGTEIWLGYVDTQGTYRILIYALDQSYWRSYKFHESLGVGAFYVEPANPLSLLIGGTDHLWSHSGFKDGVLTIPGIYRSGSLGQGQSRAQKLYGDLWVYLDRKGHEITCSLLTNDEQGLLGDTLLTTGSGLTEYIIDPFEVPGDFGVPGPHQASALSLQVNWDGQSDPPLLREWAISYLVQPEITKGRPTDWDSQGRLTDKLVKGCIVECDTKGVVKELVIEADGVVMQTISVNHPGRLSKAYAWPEFEGRLLRFNPVDAVEWQFYSWRWIFDEEPVQLTRWETQLLDHGLSGWHSIPFAYISYRTAPVGELDGSVTLEIDVYDQSGNLTQTFSPTPPLTGTGGKKIKRFVGFPAAKGCFYKYRFTSTVGHWLYREESSVFVQPWDGTSGKWLKPWGTDDLDGVRGLSDAGAGASRSGGGEG